LWLSGRERLSWSVVFLGAIDAQLVAKAASDDAGAAQQAAAFVEENAFNATSGHDCGWRGRGSVAPVCCLHVAQPSDFAADRGDDGCCGASPEAIWRPKFRPPVYPVGGRADRPGQCFSRLSRVAPGSVEDRINRSNGCGIAVRNFGFASALLIQPSTVIRRGEYMHVGPQVAGAITQFNVTADPRSVLSTYKFRTYLGASH
jgi:hypothetical protein